MPTTAEMIEVVAECLCKAHTFQAKVPLSALPLAASACHCHSCRHATGALFSMDIRWPEKVENVDTSALKRYAFSSKIAVLWCETCSTPLFFESANETARDLGVFTGALKNHENVDLVKIVDHIFVGDTIDGGASLWLKKPNSDGSEASRFKGRDDTENYSYDWDPTESSLEAKKEEKAQSVPIRCHCKGIDLLLHRGNYGGKIKDELPEFINPKTHKPIANFDLCNSCRLQSGIDIFNWTFSELSNISCSESDTPFPQTTTELQTAVDEQDPAIGTLAYYRSRSDVQRYFCKVCSATAFYAIDCKSDQVDIAVGLLDAASGARAESFLDWDAGDFDWADDTKGGWREGLVGRLQAEVGKWRGKRGAA